MTQKMYAIKTNENKDFYTHKFTRRTWVDKDKDDYTVLAKCKLWKCKKSAIRNIVDPCESVYEVSRNEKTNRFVTKKSIRRIPMKKPIKRMYSIRNTTKTGSKTWINTKRNSFTTVNTATKWKTLSAAQRNIKHAQTVMVCELYWNDTLNKYQSRRADA